MGFRPIVMMDLRSQDFRDNGSLRMVEQVHLNISVRPGDDNVERRDCQL